MKRLSSVSEIERAIDGDDEHLVIVDVNRTDEPVQLDEAWEEEMQPCAVVYHVDIDKVPELKVCATKFFFHSKNIVVDLGTANKDRRNWIVSNHEHFLQLVKSLYEAAQRGRGLMVSPWEYSARFHHVQELFQH